jgi:hypothetical protein
MPGAPCDHLKIHSLCSVAFARQLKSIKSWEKGKGWIAEDEYRAKIVAGRERLWGSRLDWVALGEPKGSGFGEAAV